MDIIGNSSLTNLNFAPPQTGGVFYIYSNGQLSDINFLTPLSSSTTVSRIDLHANRFTGWTTNFPTQVSRIDMEQQQGGFSLGVNSFRYFSPDLSNNTGLTQLNLYTNSLTSITETISGCTSLTNLRVDRNQLKTLPPILPNSITDLTANSNYFTGYTSNFPTSMNYFNINKGTGNPSLPTWNVEITGATNLQTFLANSVGLTAWTKNFPTSIVTIDFSENSLTSFLNSISGNTSLVTLSLNNNNLTSIPPIFPNSIQTLELQNNDLTGYTSNIPTSLVTFSIENQFVIGNYIPEWSQELTGSTNLNSLLIIAIKISSNLSELKACTFSVIIFSIFRSC
jgi:Leucine-rich repeat (LRR) protein